MALNPSPNLREKSMLNIHTLSQGCIQTNSNFSDCQWNALAEQWLNSPTKKNLLSNLKRHSASLLGAPNNNLKSACIVAFINNSHIYYWHCHSLCLGEDVFVFLTPNHLLNFAFGAPLTKQHPGFSHCQLRWPYFGIQQLF